MVKRGGKWLVPEYCESTLKKEELAEQFFDDDTIIPSIAIFSFESTPPEDMGFFAPGYKKLESREQRKKKKERKKERKKEVKKWSRQSKRLPLLHRRRRQKSERRRTEG